MGGLAHVILTTEANIMKKIIQDVTEEMDYVVDHIVLHAMQEI